MHTLRTQAAAPPLQTAGASVERHCRQAPTAEVWIRKPGRRAHLSKQCSVRCRGGPSETRRQKQLEYCKTPPSGAASACQFKPHPQKSTRARPRSAPHRVALQVRVEVAARAELQHGRERGRVDLEQVRQRDHARVPQRPVDAVLAHLAAARPRVGPSAAPEDLACVGLCVSKAPLHGKGSRGAYPAAHCKSNSEPPHMCEAPSGRHSVVPGHPGARRMWRELLVCITHKPQQPSNQTKTCSCSRSPARPTDS